MAKAYGRPSGRTKAISGKKRTNRPFRKIGGNRGRRKSGTVTYLARLRVERAEAWVVPESFPERVGPLAAERVLVAADDVHVQVEL